MKLLSWNLNGMRSVVKRGFIDFLRKEKPDIVGVQEIKMSDAAREKQEFDFKGYQEFWNPAERPGYSGTAVFVKDGLEVLNYAVGFGGFSKGTAKPADKEGRVQTLEFEKFYFINLYFPNANHELTRLDFKEKFNAAFLKYVKKLEKRKPVITCGDFNVAHEEIDIKNVRSNIGNPGFTYEERGWMTTFLKSGLTDTFRRLNPTKVQYSWWSLRANVRARNIGWRIDYFVVSDKITKKIKKAFILDKVMGSDHAPVGIILETEKK